MNARNATARRCGASFAGAFSSVFFTASSVFGPTAATVATFVSWDSSGNIYFTDGYGNSRVAKYDKNGDWVKSWGEYGTAPGQFRLPHAIVADRNDNLYVGDRMNHRVQVFDTDAKFLRMFTIDIPPVPGTKAVNGNTPTGDRLTEVIGAPNSICITPGPNQVLFIGESTFPGRIFKVALDGKVPGVIWALRTPVEGVLRRPRVSVPLRNGRVRSGNFQLARAEIDHSLDRVHNDIRIRDS